jgi:hypothetical protein
MKGPCENCPFRRDVKPFLTALRGMQLAALTRHPDGIFHCHKTCDYSDADETGQPSTANATLCKGFAILRAQESGNRFVKPDETVYGSMGEMIMAYAREGF